MKDPAVAMDFRPPPQTEPLFGDLDLDEFGLGPLFFVAAVPFLVAVVVAAVVLAVR